MFLNPLPKKRKIDLVTKPVTYFIQNKVTKSNKGAKSKIKADDSDDGDGETGDPESPLQQMFPNAFKHDEDNLIYLKNNHLYFHTEVSEDSVDKVKKLMRQYWNKISHVKKTHELVEVKPKPLYLHIFSTGGCVYSGFSLYDFVIEYKKKIPVYTIVEGMAASAATFFSVAGTKRFMTPNSYVLIHQLSTMIGGNFEQIQDGYDNSKKSMEKIMQIYKTHTKINKKKIPNILKHDLNWDAEESLRYGLVDEVKLIDIFNDDEHIGDDMHDGDNVDNV
jgi:ATP-dependent protease ClpP protease subunit